MAKNPAREKQLTAFVRVQARYQRAMNIERDVLRGDALSGYLVTPLVRRALTRVVAGLQEGSTERAWSLTGPYGSGKTAFGVFLTNLFGLDAPATRRARSVLGDTDSSLLRAVPKAPLVPVVIAGERAPLDVLVLRGLKRTLETQWSTRRGSKPAVFADVSRLAERLEHGKGACKTSDLVRSVEGTLAAVASAFGAGLLFIIDEAGKILEYAAEHPNRGDLHGFQALAELASSNTQTPFLFIAVLHQAFDQYAARLTATQRNEWAKVQGRFTDLIFQEEPNEIVRLIGAALEPAAQRPTVPGWTELVADIADWMHEGVGWDRKIVRRYLDRCWPLHPMTAVLLGPLFRGRLAQNERSLFAFLSSGEPLGFAEFLKTATQEQLYPPDQLYDYVVSNFGNNIFGREGKLWAEIDNALRGLHKSIRNRSTVVADKLVFRPDLAYGPENVSLS